MDHAYAKQIDEEIYHLPRSVNDMALGKTSNVSLRLYTHNLGVVLVDFMVKAENLGGKMNIQRLPNQDSYSTFIIELVGEHGFAGTFERWFSVWKQKTEDRVLRVEKPFHDFEDRQSISQYESLIRNLRNGNDLNLGCKRTASLEQAKDLRIRLEQDRVRIHFYLAEDRA